ncbi:MAG: arsenate reductase (glutaredoxin) [Bacteroidia bacterium]|nr:arsenate reductase (glutaredoxin) [Bacteroidia bacterium]
MQIYHNPRCGKSRKTLELIRESGREPEIIEYLKAPPNAAKIREILDKLDMSAMDLVRKGEQLFKDNFKGREYSEGEWIQILAENPILIERPIVVEGKKAIIGRPPENVNTLL